MTAKQLSLWENLRLRLTKATSAHGAKSALARKFGVSPQAVNKWLSGESTPTAEATLRLLEWVTAEEAKEIKNPERVSARPGRKTQKHQSKHEKANPSRKTH